MLLKHVYLITNIQFQFKTHDIKFKKCFKTDPKPFFSFPSTKKKFTAPITK